jgi:hypothetical protein
VQDHFAADLPFYFETKPLDLDIWGVHMAERVKGSGPEPVTSFFDTSGSTLGEQFHLLSQPNSDPPSDLISSRDTDLALSESETLMALFSESDGDKNTDLRWESHRYRREKWSVAIVALIAIGIVIAVPLVTGQHKIPKQTATEPAPAVARQSGETLLASAEQNRPRDPANELNSGLTPDNTAVAIKSVGQSQNPPPQALDATQNSARLVDKEELANLLKRGRYLLSIGDIGPARLLLERAADAHEASAAFDLAGTYDPAVLTRSHVLGIAPDFAMARMWYEKALNLGHSEAQQRLAQLQK